MKKSPNRTIFFKKHLRIQLNNSFQRDEILTVLTPYLQLRGTLVGKTICCFQILIFVIQVDVFDINLKFFVNFHCRELFQTEEKIGLEKI